MKIEIEVNPEMIDSIVQKELKWHYDYIKHDLKRFRKLRKLDTHQKKDKEYFEKLFPALEVVCDYYGVKTK